MLGQTAATSRHCYPAHTTSPTRAHTRAPTPHTLPSAMTSPPPTTHPWDTHPTPPLPHLPTVLAYLCLCTYGLPATARCRTTPPRFETSHHTPVQDHGQADTFPAATARSLPSAAFPPHRPRSGITALCPALADGKLARRPGYRAATCKPRSGGGRAATCLLVTGGSRDHRGLIPALPHPALPKTGPMPHTTGEKMGPGGADLICYLALPAGCRESLHPGSNLDTTTELSGRLVLTACLSFVYTGGINQASTEEEGCIVTTCLWTGKWGNAHSLLGRQTFAGYCHFSCLFFRDMSSSQALGDPTSGRRGRTGGGGGGGGGTLSLTASKILGMDAGRTIAGLLSSGFANSPGRRQGGFYLSEAVPALRPQRAE